MTLRPDHGPVSGPVDVVLLSTYELGRQPFGLASPAAWLREAGLTVDVQDLALHRLDPDPVREARVVGVYVPMHTATRLAEPLLEQVRRLSTSAHVVAFGLYAPLNEERLRSLGVDTVLGGEFEARLAEVCRAAVAGDPVPVGPSTLLERLAFRVPDRSGLPGPDRYARMVVDGTARVAGATEASRGCRHRCRHCPITPVYDGVYRIVPPDVVLADVATQIAAGARHMTFGDPDFLNGPAHAMRVVESFHEAFPEVTYDVTVKVEHLLKHRDLLPRLRDTGCVMVTSAVESFDDRILERLAKGHTAAGAAEAVALMRSTGLALNPTFVAFTPWTDLAGYRAFLKRVADLGLVDAVSPVQYGLRLLITARSRLLELDDVAALVGPFDAAALAHPWAHPDPEVDDLQQRVMEAVAEGRRGGLGRREVVARVWEEAGAGGPAPLDEAVPVATVPYLTEPWYC